MMRSLPRTRGSETRKNKTDETSIHYIYSANMSNIELSDFLFNTVEASNLALEMARYGKIFIKSRLRFNCFKYVTHKGIS